MSPFLTAIRTGLCASVTATKKRRSLWPLHATVIHARLGEKTGDELAGLAVQQRKFRAAAGVDQPFWIQSEQVQERGVKVVLRDLVGNGVVAELIGRAVHAASLEPAAGEPPGEAVGIVVAADLVRSGVVLDHR